MLVTVSYLKREKVQIEVDDKYQLVVDYEKNPHDPKFAGMIDDIYELGAECANACYYQLMDGDISYHSVSVRDEADRFSIFEE